VLTLPWSLCYSSHVTHYDCDLWCDHPWPSVTPIVTLWQSHVILSHAPSCSCKSNKKRKEKKRNINNDLAILPSHDNTSVIVFDIAQFFLSFNYEFLFTYLKKAGLNTNIVGFFNSYHSNQSTTYTWNNFSSLAFNTNVGVGQDSALSPILSAIYLALII